MENEKKEFLAFLKNEKRRSQYTVLNLKSELKSLYAYLAENGIQELDQVTTRYIRRYCATVLTSGKQASTLKTKISRLNVFFAYLRLRQGYTKNPTFSIQAPKVKKRQP